MTMQGVMGQWNIQLNIGGLDITANPTTVPVLNWFQTIHQNLPSINLVVNDITGELLNYAMDGAAIDITLGDGGQNETTSRFNIQGSPQIALGNSYYRFKINAVLDAMPYMRKIASGLYEGQSSNALSKVAQQSGLSFDGHTTNDSQVWLPNNQTLAGFARMVSSRGWASASSSMLLAVTDKFNLLYKDLDRVINGGSKATFGQGGIPMLDYSATSRGMIANNNRALGVTASGFDSAGAFKELANISVLQLSNFFNFSSANKEAIGKLGGRLDQIVRDAGNVHDKFDDALHQNKRLRAMYSFDLNVLTDVVTDIELLSRVTANVLDHVKPSQINTALSGDYIVTSITKSLTSPKYVERLTLTSTGTN